jgi:hypothetical protein
VVVGSSAAEKDRTGSTSLDQGTAGDLGSTVPMLKPDTPLAEVKELHKNCKFNCICLNLDFVFLLADWFLVFF